MLSNDLPCDDLGAMIDSLDDNADDYDQMYEDEIYRWRTLDSNWKAYSNNHGSKKNNFIRMEQGTSDKVIDVEKCKEFCDKTTVCQYFLITKSGKCVLYQSCKVRVNRFKSDGLGFEGHTFEKGSTLILLVVNL